MSQVAEPNRRYEPPRAPIGKAGGSTDEELSAFLGGSSDDYYLEKWSGLRSGRSKLAGFNWVAAIFPIPWFLYRKLWSWAAIALIGFSFLGAVVAELIGVNFLFIRGAEFIAFGLAANVLLYRRADHVIEHGRTANADESIKWISKRGGFSELALWLGIALLAVLRLADVILQMPAS